MKVFLINGEYLLAAENETIARNLAEIYYNEVKSVELFRDYCRK